MRKKEMLDNLYDEYAIKFEGKEIVFGDGNTDTTIVLVGEAPGRDEVRLSRPFVGMAGKNLNEFLGILGMDRSAIYITNAIKYRLSEVSPRSGKLVNRPATRTEILDNCIYLQREIQIINPRYVVTLGNVPLRSVTGDFNISIGDVHGKQRSLSLLDTEHILFPLYHPASIIYNRDLKSTYVEDIKKLKNVINP